MSRTNKRAPARAEAVRLWRRGRDSNPRSPCGDAGFQVSTPAHSRNSSARKRLFHLHLRTAPESMISAEITRSATRVQLQLPPRYASPPRPTSTRCRFKSGARHFIGRRQDRGQVAAGSSPPRPAPTNHPRACRRPWRPCWLESAGFTWRPKPRRGPRFSDRLPVPPAAVEPSAT